MSINRFHVLSLALSSLLVWPVVSSCSDDDELPQPTSPVKLSEQEIEINSGGRYYSVTVSADSLHRVLATSNVSWIELDQENPNAAGSIAFYVQPNEGSTSREGIITFKLDKNDTPATLVVHQHSTAEDDANSLPGGQLTRQSRVGYGYNMLIDYIDPKSVTEAIIDYNKVVAAEQTWGSIIAEEGRSQQELQIHCSYSIEEMASWMTEQTTTETKMFFCNKKVEKFKRVSEYKLDQRTYGFSSLAKTVATRYLDEGKLESIIRSGGYDIFTSQFRKLYDEVNRAPSDQNIVQLIKTFGTHLIIYADLGGRLDYMVNFRSEETSRESVEKYMKYKNGKQKQNDETQEASHNICNSGDSLAFDIYGGSRAAIAKLTSSRSVKDPFAQIDASLLDGWLKSVTTSDPTSVSMVRCHLMPVWQLFTNATARSMIISAVLKLSSGSNFASNSSLEELAKRLEELELDNYYRFDLNSKMEQWGTDANATLVRLAYFQGLPKVEICNEYVPELRGDKRVTVYYPIYKHITNIRRGLFPGDGENPPAEITFDTKGGCYVMPLKNFKAGDRLTTVYYIDGAFYPTNMGIDIRPVSMTLKDYRVDFYEGGSNYPVVKIGPGYWIRKNITGEMYFGEPVDPYDPECYDYYTYEEQRNGMLFSNVFYGNSLAYRTNHPGTFDADVDEFGNRIHWYLPRVEDVRTLERYIGTNCKALFPKQQSGFEAQFAGYYGLYDDLNNGKAFSYFEMHYVGEYCFIPSKEVLLNSGEALVLSPNYTLRRCGINKDRNNYYPIRAYRSSYYKYQ